MEKSERKEHWETIYQTKKLENVSWYQPKPVTSLKLIEELNIPKRAKVIDVGGGDSFFVDHLLQMGYENVTVLDISKAAIDRAKERLGNRASEVNWIVADATTFTTTEKYDFWHDRAAFHFITNKADISHYLNMVKKGLENNGIVTIGTFSEHGPKKCSGIEIKQYSEKSMSDLLETHFEKINCFNVDHETPFNTVQNFTFCSFIKKK